MEQRVQGADKLLSGAGARAGHNVVVVVVVVSTSQVRTTTSIAAAATTNPTTTQEARVSGELDVVLGGRARLLHASARGHCRQVRNGRARPFAQSNHSFGRRLLVLSSVSCRRRRRCRCREISIQTDLLYLSTYFDSSRYI